jgi:putative heme-binding domain-containing protein
VIKLADDVAQRFGDIEAAGRNLAAVRDRNAAPDVRRKALQILTAQRRPELAAELQHAMSDPAIRVDAIRAIAAFDDAALGKLLVGRFDTLSDAEKAEAIQTLASRARYGRMLTEALAAGTISKRDVPPHVARQLRRVVGIRFAEVWGPVEQNAGEERAYARYRGLLNETAMKSANAARGHALFQKTCGACHKLYGEGGTIGPDITGSNRTNLEYLLSNVLNPNAEVQEAYRMVVVTTRDGRTHVGSVAAETDRQVTLRVVGGNPVTIAKADIQSRDTTPASMMPPGLFDALTDREVIDLVAYLRSVDPVKSP